LYSEIQISASKLYPLGNDELGEMLVFL